MRVDISFKYIQRSEFVDNILESNFRKIERRIKIFRSDDPIHISIHLEKNPHREQFFCRSHIYLPSSKVLVADEKSNNVSLAINKAFSALNKQLDKEKYKWQKKRRRLSSKGANKIADKASLS